MNLLSALILAFTGVLLAQTPQESEASETPQAPLTPQAAAPAEAAPSSLDDVSSLPYGDLVLSDEEARLDLRAEPRLIWALLSEELADARLDALVVEAPVDRWQLIDELWLRVEELPYLSAGWTRVRVRAGSFETDSDRLRAEDLLTALATRLVALESLKQDPALLAAPASDPVQDPAGNAALGVSAGGGAFASQPMNQAWGGYAPVWTPVFGIGSVSCVAPLAFADTYAWAYGGYGNYWPSYVSAYHGYGSSYGFGYGYSYGTLGRYTHYSSGYHHGFQHGFAHGLFYDPWFDYDDYHDYIVVVIDDDDDEDPDEWDGWENGGDAGEDGLTPDEIEAYARENLASYKIPREIEFIDELPKSTVLKVLRRELRDRELAKRS